jgi:hypothetical protein
MKSLRQLMLRHLMSDITLDPTVIQSLLILGTQFGIDDLLDAACQQRVQLLPHLCQEVLEQIPVQYLLEQTQDSNLNLMKRVPQNELYKT